MAEQRIRVTIDMIVGHDEYERPSNEEIKLDIQEAVNHDIGISHAILLQSVHVEELT